MWPVYWTKISPANSEDFTIDKSFLMFDSLNEFNFGEYSCVSSNNFVKSEAQLYISSKGISILNRTFRKIPSTEIKKIIKKFRIR